MGTFLALMQPEEPYTFSNDQKSKYDNDEERTGKESYYIDSNVLPEQTTIWGMMRLLLLERMNKLKSNFNYSDDDLKEIHDLIGKESFDFHSEEKQDFGKLKSISPVFLCEYKDIKSIQYIVKNPSCNKAKAGFVPYKMEKTDIMTEYGSVALPLEDYKSKKGPSGGYINLETLKVYEENDFFVKYVQAGNKKNKDGKIMTKEDDDGSFFRRTKYCIKNIEGVNRAIAFFVEVDDIDLEDKIPSKEAGKADITSKKLVTLGAGKNVFSIQFIRRDNDLIERVKALGQGRTSRWGYALSDIVLSEVPQYKKFSIVSMRSVRNLKTVSYKKDHKSKTRFERTGDKIMLINRGSVFYEDNFILKEKEQLEMLGYNKIVSIGGKS